MVTDRAGLHSSLLAAAGFQPRTGIDLLVKCPHRDTPVTLRERQNNEIEQSISLRGWVLQNSFTGTKEIIPGCYIKDFERFFSL